jgi:hypothetical protein
LLALLSWWWRHGRHNRRRSQPPKPEWNLAWDDAELTILKAKYATGEIDAARLDFLTGRVITGESASTAVDRKKYADWLIAASTPTNGEV